MDNRAAITESGEEEYVWHLVIGRHTLGPPLCLGWVNAQVLLMKSEKGMMVSCKLKTRCSEKSGSSF